MWARLNLTAFGFFGSAINCHFKELATSKREVWEVRTLARQLSRGWIYVETKARKTEVERVARGCKLA